MSFDIVFTPEAEAEYYEIIQYYESKRRGLGFEFVIIQIFHKRMSPSQQR